MNPKQRSFYLSLTREQRLAVLKAADGRSGGPKFIGVLEALMKDAPEKKQEPAPKPRKKAKEKKKRVAKAPQYYNPLSVQLPHGSKGRDLMMPTYFRTPEERAREEASLPMLFQDRAAMEVLQGVTRVVLPRAISLKTRGLLGALTKLEKDGAKGKLSRSKFLRRHRVVSRLVDRSAEEPIPRQKVSAPYSLEYLQNFWERSTNKQPWWATFGPPVEVPLRQLRDGPLKGRAFPQVNVTTEKRWNEVLDARRELYTRNLYRAQRRYQRAELMLRTRWNANKVTERQLRTIPGIGPVRARMIRIAREKACGAFKSISEFPLTLQWLFEDNLYLDGDAFHMEWDVPSLEAERDVRRAWNQLSDLVDWKARGFAPIIYRKEVKASTPLDITLLQIQQEDARQMAEAEKADHRMERMDTKMMVKYSIEQGLEKLQEVHTPMSGNGPDHVSVLKREGLFTDLSKSRFGKVVAFNRENGKVKGVQHR